MIVATTERLLRLLSNESLSLRNTAIIVLDEEKPNAVEGVDYISPWYGSESDLVGKEFMLTGWGLAGEES